MHSYSMDLGGRTLTIEAGKIAKQANGAVLVRYGDTAVVVAVTGTKTPREGVDFFPLTVDFEEKMYAVGKIPGGFIKREGRPSEQAILTSRLIDRPIRPMFPEGYHNDVQIVATAVSVDPDNAPDMPAMVGASCALSINCDIRRISAKRFNVIINPIERHDLIHNSVISTYPLLTLCRKPRMREEAKNAKPIGD